MKTSRLFLILLLLIASVTPLQAMAQAKTLICDDIFYPIRDNLNQYKIVNISLTPMYSDNFDKEFENMSSIDIKTAFYVNGDMAFSEIKPATLISYDSFVESENGEMTINYILDLELNQMSKSISKRVTTTCSSKY